MIHLRHRLFWLLSGWSFVVTVVIASVYPMVLLSALPFAWGDKLVHALAYFLMMIWFAGLYARRHQAIVALFVLALGFLMEMVQWWLPYRFFEPADLVANAVGVAAGLGMSLWLLAGWCQGMESRLRYDA